MPARITAIILFITALSACTGPANVYEQDTRPTGKSNTVESALYAQLAEWRGTPYRLGGNSRRGIDCSGFVQNTFQRQFDSALPRTTELQVREGKKISKSQLRTGDLVFFRTGRGVRHVGIYLNDGQFIHASKSAGVTQSDMNSSYWAPRFWQARRLAGIY
ncbi:MAG: NlpC/P60 family protein [Pseudomonadota bacterium]